MNYQERLSKMNELKIGNKTANVPIIQGGMGVGVSRSRLAGAVAAASAAMLMAGQARTKVRKNRTSHCPAVALTARAVVASALRAM